MQEWLPQCDSNVAKKGVAKAIADNVASHIINLDLLRLDNIKEIKRETSPTLERVCEATAYLNAGETSITFRIFGLDPKTGTALLELKLK